MGSFEFLIILICMFIIVSQLRKSRGYQARQRYSETEARKFICSHLQLRYKDRFSVEIKGNRVEVREISMQGMLYLSVSTQKGNDFFDPVWFTLEPNFDRSAFDNNKKYEYPELALDHLIRDIHFLLDKLDKVVK